MTLNELITELSNKGVTLSAEKDQLRIRALKGVLTPELKEQLSERKEEILSLLKQGKAESGMACLPAIVPSPEERFKPFPMTEIQQAYWIGRGEDFELGNVATHAYVEIENKELDLVRLNRAWQQLIDRHDMLRAVVLPSGEQKVLEEVPPYEIKVMDLRGKAPEEVSSQLQAVREKMSHQVLPAYTWPLFEIRATRLDDRVRLHISLDLLIADLWSLLRLFDEWHQLYENESTPFTRPEVSFRDYVLTEQSLHHTDLYQRSRDYWLNRLEALPAAPDLPLHKNPGAISKPRFVRRSAHLNRKTWQELKQRATQAGLTPSGVLLGAFNEVLMQWSKSSRFTINMTLFNRLPLHPQVNDLIGDFTTTILLEVDNTMPKPFLARAQQQQHQLWKDLDHRYFNGVRLLREMTHRQGGYSTATMPVVFTSALGLDSLGQDTEYKGFSFSGNGRTRRENDGSCHGVWEHFHHFGEVVYGITQTPQVWLDHQVIEQDGELVFNWDSVDELFPDGLLDAMFKAYSDLLKRLAASDEAWQETGGKLTPADQLSQRAAVNETTAPVSGELLHTLFSAQVKKRAGEYAVISSRRNLTYRELSERSNQAAHRLRRLGAVPNTLVAVVMEKGWEQVVAVLGVLQSGSAYLPIDPELPLARRNHLLESSQVRLVLTQSKYNEQLDWPEGIQRICVDNEDLSQESTLPLETVQGPEDLAYVIYTSGSTGLPKGVMIDHRGAVNTILDINRRFFVGPRDRVLALSALSFDLSVYDIFGLLAAGGALVIPDAEGNKDAAHWVDLMVEHNITLWNTVPALMQMLAEYFSGRSDKAASSLRLVMMSGDWIPLDLPGRIQGLWPDIRMFSLGGATEASIWSIFYPIEKADPAWKSIPYGKPLTNQTFHVLNELMEPCPIWVPGQLYIGGIGLAKGFWGDEKKTRASFIVHPKTGEQLYKTGDLGRYLPDNNIEFLGREDFQVKINGYRIELGEIEAVLKEHPAVREAIVSAVGEEKESKRLVAYVVTNQGQKEVRETAEDYEPRLKDGVILAHGERAAFKLGQPGIRKLDPDQRSIPLVRPVFDEETRRAYLERQSFREYLEAPVPLDRFSRFLSCLLQWNAEDAPLPKYRYPSAGSLYPVQAYLYLKPDRVEGLEGGIYYYHPAEHGLVLINANARVERSVYSGYGGTNQRIFDECGFAIYLVGRMNAIAPLYGDWARDFCVLEAGYMGQLLSEAAPREEIGLCAIGDLMFDEIREYFNLEPSHVLVHSFLGGRIDPSQVLKLSVQTLSAAVSLDDQLQSHLRGRIPEYMIPTHYQMLDSLPLSSNGKVDRKALPEPDFTKAIVQGDNDRPRTPTEETIASIFCNLFTVQQVGVDDNFFERGGDSLLATQLISKVREAFNLELTLRNVFNSPTVAGVAECIETARWATQGAAEADLTRDGRDEVEF